MYTRCLTTFALEMKIGMRFSPANINDVFLPPTELSAVLSEAPLKTVRNAMQ